MWTALGARVALLRMPDVRWRCAPLAFLLPLMLAACGERSEPGDAGGGALPDAGPEVEDAGGSSFRLTPDHGPFSGGHLALLRGGELHSATPSVRFGDVAVPAQDVLRIASDRIRVIVPPHAPGRVDVSVRDGAIEHTLDDAYEYYAVSVSPATGAPEGGTRITLRAASDLFAPDLRVTLDGQTCADVTIVSAREATCRTPPHPIGAVDVGLTVGSDALTLAEAFTYESPFRSHGGLSGGPAEGRVTVLVRVPNGMPLENATVVAGPRGGPLSHRAVTGADGIVVLTGDDLRGRVDVIAWHPCAFDAGFLGAEATHVTLGLVGVDYRCLGASGEPSGGGGVVYPDPEADVSGEIVFYGDELMTSPTFDWSGLPEPRPGQTRAAYVWLVTQPQPGDPSGAQVVSGPLRVSDERGTRGYPFAVESVRSKGLLVPIAMAGLETDGSLASFEPHVLGLGAPFALPVSGVEAGVEIPMDTPVMAGRSVALAPPADPPTVRHLRQDGLLDDDAVSRQQLFVRYSVPGVVTSVVLERLLSGAWVYDPTSWGPLASSVAVPWQPSPEGSFRGAIQEMWAVVRAGPEDLAWGAEQYLDLDLSPHSRIALRTPISTEAVDAGAFLPIPDLPAVGPLPADRTFRFEVGGAGEEAGSLIRIRVGYNNVERSWGSLTLFAHPSVRSVVLPPELDEIGQAVVFVEVLDVAGLEFDRVDLQALRLANPRRRSLNLTAILEAP